MKDWLLTFGVTVVLGVVISGVTHPTHLPTVATFFWWTGTEGSWLGRAMHVWWRVWVGLPPKL